MVLGAPWVPHGCPSVLGADGARTGEHWPGGMRLRALCRDFL